MDSREYLNYVLDKLQERIRKLDDAILHGQKEIENMHEYYWENYTEMDQYGYEDFDNQQALLGQVNANKEKLDPSPEIQKDAGFPVFRAGGFHLRRRRRGRNVLYRHRQFFKRIRKTATGL